MKLKELLQVLNTSNYIGMHELIDNGNNYEMIYTGRIKTKEEMERIINKYGERKVNEIDTSIDEGQLIYIELGEKYV